MLTTGLNQIDRGHPANFEEWPRIDYMNIDMREDLHTLHTIINELNLWDEFTTDPGEGGFASCNAAHVEAVTNDPRISSVFSGMSEAYALRLMHEIAKNGWEAFKAKYNNISLNPVEAFCRRPGPM